VQLHPRTPALYVLAAAHELAHSGMGAARVLLQRGLRLNAGAPEMWREYVRLELGFVEAVRRRWDVLGIALDESGEGERVDKAEEVAMGDAARRAIMDGAIVRQAIDSAAKGIKSPSSSPLSSWRRGLSSYLVVNSATDDRAVPRFADARCGVSGFGVSSPFAAGSPARPIG
jgi:U3 small nucleolar RNA-associated protein 6